MIIYNDLLRVAVKSNSNDLRKYLDNIELGDYLYSKIIGENVRNEFFDNLDALKQKEALEIFVSHLETLYRNSKQGKNDNTDISNYSLVEKIKYLKEKFSPTVRYDLKDRIVRSFGYSAGYTSFIEIRKDMNESIKNNYNRTINHGIFEFDDGDFLRCIGGYEALAASLENGNFSKEYLTVFKEANISDTTPLDIDFTLIKKEQSIYHSIALTPTGFGFGNIFVVIKHDNPNLNITRDEFGNLTNAKYNPKKMEMFGTSVHGSGYQTHWGVRTGMSILGDVDYIIYKENRKIDSSKPYDENGNVNYVQEGYVFDDLPIVKFEIVKRLVQNGCDYRENFLIDFSGKPLLSSEEFYDIKRQMNGIKEYGMSDYVFSTCLEDVPLIEHDVLEASNQETEAKRNKINYLISEVLKAHNLYLKTKIDGDLTPGSIEVIDTGSTGRKTNKIGDSDFDLLLRIDQNIAKDNNKYKQLKKDLATVFTDCPHESCIITDSGDYRLKGVQIDENTRVDIDLSFTIKTDKMIYSTDECLKDRLETIKKQDIEKYEKVISNIIFAKKMLKEAGCYKTDRSDKSQGGLGGAGIENWILQHGGSFKEASISFLERANGKSFEEFKKCYYIWDFGENHFAERKGLYSHDNFVANMNAQGYEKMKQCLKQYLAGIYYVQNISDTGQVLKII